MLKFLKWCCLCLTICFALFGFIYGGMADASKGTNVRFVTTVGDERIETSEGQIGGSEENYKIFSQGGITFFVLAGITGVATIVAFIKDKKSR